MKKILMLSLLACMQVHSAAERSDNLYIINNTRQPMYVRVRKDTPTKPVGTNGIIKLSKDKSIRVLHNVEKTGPLRLRIWPESFASNVSAPNPEEYAYSGMILQAGNVVVITKQIAADGLVKAIKDEFEQPGLIHAIEKGAKSPSSESLSLIIFDVRDINDFKNKLYQLMSKWSSIKLDSRYETEQILENTGEAFTPVKVGSENIRPEQKRRGPELDVEGLKELEKPELSPSRKSPGRDVMRAVFGENA